MRAGRLILVPLLTVPLLLAVTRGAAAGPGAAPAGSHVGIPFGPFSMPVHLFGSAPFTAVYERPTPGTIVAMLEASRASRWQVVVNLAGGKADHKNPDESFSLVRWKQSVDRFRGIDLGPYIADGTILGHFLIDEPHAGVKWNGRPVPLEEVEAAAQYSKKLWPDMATLVRSHATFLQSARFRWTHLDAGWAQYSARFGPVEAYLRRNVAAARSLGLGLVVGLNALDGGTADSRIPGWKSGKWAMSAEQLEKWGAVLAAEPYACGLFLWKYDWQAPSYFARPDIQQAITRVAEIGRNRPRTSCRMR
jgi:hypothetical protein